MRRRGFISVIPVIILILLGVNFLYHAALQENSLSNFMLKSNSGSRKVDHGSYLVSTASCKIADMNPHDLSTAVVAVDGIRNSTTRTCDEPLVYASNGTLILNELHPRYKHATCCYQKLHRVTVRNFTKFEADWSNAFSECKPISKSRRTKISSEFVKTVCKYTENGRKETWEDFYATPSHPEWHSESTQSKYKYWEGKPRTEAQQKPPSVLIIGIDSVSRLHMLRSLPETKRFLEVNDFIEMKGYTKIGENTFPNMMAALGGMKFDEYPCWKHRFGELDECPLIWKNFSGNHYITAMIEDAAAYGTFNYMKAGFVEQPADYYLRPITVAYHGDRDKESPYWGCVSGMNQTAFMMKYTREVVAGLSKLPYFVWSWFTTLSHDDFRALPAGDHLFRTNLEEMLESEGDDAVILFISDHGYRFGPYRESLLGYYEESLPFFFIRLPPYLKDKYPHWYENLLVNSNRLTSPLDLHATLEDILSLSTDITPFPFTHNNWEVPFREVYSFFEKTPLNRTCASCNIPQQYCRCNSFSDHPVDTNFFHRLLRKPLMDNILGVIGPQISIGNCAPLAFKKFVYIRQFEGSEHVAHVRDGGKDFQVAFEVSPSDAKYEAKVRVYPDSSFKIFGYIARINTYKGQSECMEVTKYKWYCLCTWRKNQTGLLGL